MAPMSTSVRLVRTGESRDEIRQPPASPAADVGMIYKGLIDIGADDGATERDSRLADRVTHEVFTFRDEKLGCCSLDAVTIMSTLAARREHLFGVPEIARLSRLPTDRCLSALDELYARDLLRLKDGTRTEGSVAMNPLGRLGEQLCTQGRLLDAALARATCAAEHAW